MRSLFDEFRASKIRSTNVGVAFPFGLWGSTEVTLLTYHVTRVGPRGESYKALRCVPSFWEIQLIINLTAEACKHS